MLPLIAVDIGNSRVKLGVFVEPLGAALPTPAHAFDLNPNEPRFEARIGEWLAEQKIPAARWLIASVNRIVRQHLITWIASARPRDVMLPLNYQELPLEIAVAEPERVGIDRLLGAVAANRLRAAGQRAIIVDLGSAVTVDLVSEQGAFLGGAILPGIGMSARALHEQTDMLPDIGMTVLESPPAALGDSTIAAIQSGIYWGAVGAVRELIAQFSRDAATPPLVLLTGGAAPAVAQLLGDAAQYHAHLILAGIALVRSGEAAR